MRYHFTLVRMAIIKESTNKCWRGCRKKGTLLHCWWECELIQPLRKTVWKFLKKLGIKPPYDPAIPLLGIYPAAAAAKSLQSCTTLWDPRDDSPPGSSIRGIFQARVLEWHANAFIIREIQIKTTVRYHSHLSQWPSSKSRQTINSLEGVVALLIGM